MDSITETIAHFIGVFSIQLERARMREEYDEFSALLLAPYDPEALKNVNVALKTSYALDDVNAKVDYEHNWPTFPPLSLGDIQLAAPFNYFPTFPIDQFEIATIVGTPFFWAVFSYQIDVIYDLDPAGSVAVVIGQQTQNLDRDFICMSSESFNPLPFGNFEVQLDYLVDRTESLSPMNSIAPPADEDAIMAIIDDAAQTLKDLNEDSETGDQGKTLLGDDAYGLFTNGQNEDTAPSFSEAVDALSKPKEAQLAVSEVEPPTADENGALDATGTNKPLSVVDAPTEVIDDTSGASGDGGLQLETGANKSINQVGLTDAWTDAPAMVVLGDYVSVQMISQTNVWQNVDFGHLSSSQEDVAVNTASITKQNTQADRGSDVEPKELGAPENWAIARLEANLISLNWLDQFNEIYDEDLVSWQQGGSDTYLQTGGNSSSNLVSLFEYGLQYDLILISGSVLQANIIQQHNILLDNDRLDPGQPSGAVGDELGASGNLLWNSAHIHTVGETSFESLPAAYLAAVKDVSDGGRVLPDQLLADPVFAGTEFLNVLYVDGDYLDLNYFRQTNVVSDADQIKLSVGEGNGSFAVETDANILANFASILDLGTDTTAYVGGEVYTDALLYQANFIEPPTPFGLSEPSELTSEAVLFLADDMLQPSVEETEGLVVATVSNEAHTADIMQSVTG